MADPIVDPYLVLGVRPDAGPRQIAAAYRRLARRYHPDLNSDPAAPLAMRRINTAWQSVARGLRTRRYPAGGERRGYMGARPTPASRSRTPPLQPTAGAHGRPRPSGRAPDGVAGHAPESRDLRDSGWMAAMVGVGVVLFVFIGAYVANLPYQLPA